MTTDDLLMTIAHQANTIRLSEAALTQLSQQVRELNDRVAQVSRERDEARAIPRQAMPETAQCVPPLEA